MFTSPRSRKFHLKTCRHLGNNVEPVSAEEAQTRALSACMHCHAASAQKSGRKENVGAQDNSDTIIASVVTQSVPEVVEKNLSDRFDSVMAVHSPKAADIDAAKVEIVRSPKKGREEDEVAGFEVDSVVDDSGIVDSSVEGGGGFEFLGGKGLTPSPAGNSSFGSPRPLKKVTLDHTAVVTRTDGRGTPERTFSESHDRETLAKVGVVRNLSARLFTPVKDRPEPADVEAIAQGVLSELLPPAEWNPTEEEDEVRPFACLSARSFMLICKHLQRTFAAEPTMIKLKAPVKVFGDVHGQLGDLLDFFKCYGIPHHHTGDVSYVNYCFIGDFVDRGSFSLECVALLFCLKVLYPQRVTLLRGNHEDREINSLYGFKEECLTRFKNPAEGERVWKAVNDAFDVLPLAALVEESIFVCHGGIGDSVETLAQVQAIERPVYPNGGEVETEELSDRLVCDLLWSDPTENDGVVGVHANGRGDDLVTFGPDRVKAFCKRNKLQLIIRAHECVQAGYQFFAEGHLITVFSATNYCGMHQNAGAMLLIDPELNVQPRVITGCRFPWNPVQYRPPSPMRK